MKIYISYFYQIRFFSPNMIPISNAVNPELNFNTTTITPPIKILDGKYFNADLKIGLTLNTSFKKYNCKPVDTVSAITDAIATP